MICPSGYFAILLSASFTKIFPFSFDPNQKLEPVSSTVLHEGRIAIVTDAGWDAVDAAALGVRT